MNRELPPIGENVKDLMTTENLTSDIPNESPVAAEISTEEKDQAPAKTEETDGVGRHQNRNVILLGVMGAGKSTVGWLLAKLIGYGFISLDEWIVEHAGKSVADIFNQDGEGRFRQLEKEAINSLSLIKSHVISVGGGAVVEDENWEKLKEMGTTVWLNPPVEEVARRIYMRPAELEKRPLLSDLVKIEEHKKRESLLSDRIATLLKQRLPRYKEAELILEGGYSTPDASAQMLKMLLIKQGILKMPRKRQPFNRWFS